MESARRNPSRIRDWRPGHSDTSGMSGRTGQGGQTVELVLQDKRGAIPGREPDLGWVLTDGFLHEKRGKNASAEEPAPSVAWSQGLVIWGMANSFLYGP